MVRILTLAVTFLALMAAPCTGSEKVSPTDTVSPAVVGGESPNPLAASPVPTTTPPCTGSISGHLVLGYDDRSPAAGEWIQIAGMPGDPAGNRKLVQTSADGGFRVAGVPIGSHRGFARHAQFEFTIERCGQHVHLGEVEYPLVHPG